MSNTNLPPHASWPFSNLIDINASTTGLAATKSDRTAWTLSEIKYFAEMHVNGMTPQQIAEKLDGRSAKAISNQLSDMRTLKTETGKKLAAEIEKCKERLSSRAREQAAEANRITAAINKALTKTVSHGPAKRPLTKPANHRASWDAAADKALVTGFAAGQTPEMLADLCGRTKAAVAARLHALHLLIFDKDTLTYLTAPKVWLKVA